MEGSQSQTAREDDGLRQRALEIRRGHDESDLRKLLGENMLRVLEETQRVAGDL